MSESAKRWRAGTQPIPVRLTPLLVLPVAAVEHYLRTGVLPAQTLARQHGAEDGSDRSEWAPSRTPEARIDLAARSLHRDFEYALDWRSVRGADAPGVLLVGRIDLLWEDADGGWNVLLHAGNGVVPGDPWCGRKASLLLAALAAQRRFGKWPRRVVLHKADGKQSSIRGQLRAHRTIFDAVDAALRQLTAPRRGHGASIQIELAR